MFLLNKQIQISNFPLKFIDITRKNRGSSDGGGWLLSYDGRQGISHDN